MDMLKADSDILLSTLNVQSSEKVVIIREDHMTDSNFILSHLIKQIFLDQNNGLCLVTLHNTIEHYYYVGKRLNYNLYEKINENCAYAVEPLTTIVDDIGEKSPKYLSGNTEDTAKKIFLDIEEKIQKLFTKKSGVVYVVIDDLSHLLDLGLQMKDIVVLINTLANLNERVNLIIGTHTSGSNDLILCNALTYISDVLISVSPLKTGRSFYVSGIMSITRKRKPIETYYFKATERGIKIFKEGESVQHLINS